MNYTPEQEKAIQLKKKAIKDINTLLEKYINCKTPEKIKKAKLISYWLQEYAYLINFEEIFEPRKNISYKRGDIVKLKFGFNIGSEYGGLHYAVVLDIDNPHSSPVVTVIPLTSKKPNSSIHHYNIDLGNELYKLLNFKFNTTYNALQQDITKSQKLISILDPLAVDDGVTPPEVQELIDEFTSHVKHTKIKSDFLEKLGGEISKMKHGSIAIMNQVTTISKIRIVDPRTTEDILSGIRLSSEAMDKINEKLKTLYIFE